MSQRWQNRATAFRFPFQWEFNPTDRLSEDLREFIELEHEEEYYAYSFELVDGVLDKIEILDSIIKELVTNWDFSRIAKADLAFCVLPYMKSNTVWIAPPVVIIDETLRLVRSFPPQTPRSSLTAFWTSIGADQETGSQTGDLICLRLVLFRRLGIQFP